MPESEPAFTPCAELALPPAVTGTVGLLKPACWWPEPPALADAAGGAGIVVDFAVVLAVEAEFAAACSLAAAALPVLPTAVLLAFPEVRTEALPAALPAASPAVAACVPSS